MEPNTKPTGIKPGGEKNHENNWRTQLENAFEANKENYPENHLLYDAYLKKQVPGIAPLGCNLSKPFRNTNQASDKDAIFKPQRSNMPLSSFNSMTTGGNGSAMNNSSLEASFQGTNFNFFRKGPICESGFSSDINSSLGGKCDGSDVRKVKHRPGCLLKDQLHLETTSALEARDDSCGQTHGGNVRSNSSFEESIDASDQIQDPNYSLVKKSFDHGYPRKSQLHHEAILIPEHKDEYHPRQTDNGRVFSHSSFKENTNFRELTRDTHFSRLKKDLTLEPVFTPDKGKSSLDKRGKGGTLFLQSEPHRPCKDDRNNLINSSYSGANLSELTKRKISIVVQKVEDEKQMNRNSVFVVRQDGMVLEVNNGLQKPVLNAITQVKNMTKYVNKMRKAKINDKNANKHHKITRRDQNEKQQEALKSTKRAAVTDLEIKGKILLGSVQLVESLVPLSEADNYDQLTGMFLFRQIFSFSRNPRCLFCREKYPVQSLADLVKHYRATHDWSVHIHKAEFSQNRVFVPVPSEMKDETTLRVGCQFCDAILTSFGEVKDHYPKTHNKTIRLLPEQNVTNIDDYLYCGMCNHASVDFTNHIQHMEILHDMRICKYSDNNCVPQPKRLKTTKKQTQLQQNFECPACFVSTKGLKNLLEHVAFSHAVQTGPKIWSCTKCLYPYGDPQELADHFPICPKTNHQEITSYVYPRTYFDLSNTDGPVCHICGMRFPSVEKCEKHQHHVHMSWVERGNHSADEHPDLQNDKLFLEAFTLLNTKYGDILAEFECKVLNPSELSDKPIPSPREETDVLEFSMAEFDASSLYEVPESNPNLLEIYSAQGPRDAAEEKQVVLLTANDIAADQPSGPTSHIDILGEAWREVAEDMDVTQFSDNSVEFNPLHSIKVTSTSSGGLETEASTEYKRLGGFNISIDDLPNDQELSEMGFPVKIGHYCHLCDAVIKSYRLYYLHMHNLHQLVKQFQCVVTACGKSFSQAFAFQEHGLYHNQMSQHHCGMCDYVFGDSEELHRHTSGLDHASKYEEIQASQSIGEARNHLCKVCGIWFGLFATFIWHMETEGHNYPCSECGVPYVQPGLRRSHIQRSHPAIANTCEFCGLKLTTSKELWKHLRTHSIGCHECQICHSWFFEKRLLGLHSRTHASLRRLSVMVLNPMRRRNLRITPSNFKPIQSWDCIRRMMLLFLTTDWLDASLHLLGWF